MDSVSLIAYVSSRCDYVLARSIRSATSQNVRTNCYPAILTTTLPMGPSCSRANAGFTSSKEKILSTTGRLPIAASLRDDLFPCSLFGFRRVVRQQRRHRFGLLRNNSDAVLKLGTAPALLPTTLIRPRYPRIDTSWSNSGPPMLSMTRSTFFGAMAAFTLLRRCGSFGSRTTSAPNAFSLADFSALRDNATTVRPIDWPSNTDATPRRPTRQ